MKAHLRSHSHKNDLSDLLDGFSLGDSTLCPVGVLLTDKFLASKLEVQDESETWDRIVHNITSTM